MFFIALSCFVMSVAVGVTMAGYRDSILGIGQTDVPVAETTASLQSLQTVILLSLAALLFIGALFASTSFETFFSALLAGLTAVSGLLLGVVSLLLGVVDLLVAVILIAVTTLREAFAPLTETLHGGMRSAKAGGSAVWTKLRNLVAPRGTAAPRKEPSENSSQA